MFNLVQLLHPKAILIQKEIKNYFKRTFNLFVSRPDSKYKPVLLLVKNTKLRSISKTKKLV
jgi:hypothetical protein